MCVAALTVSKQRSLARNTYCAQIGKSEYSKNSNIELDKNSHRQNCILNLTTRKMCLPLSYKKRPNNNQHSYAKRVKEIFGVIMNAENSYVKQRGRVYLLQSTVRRRWREMKLNTHTITNAVYRYTRTCWRQRAKSMITAHMYAYSSCSYVNLVEVAEWSLFLSRSLFDFLSFFIPFFISLSLPNVLQVYVLACVCADERCKVLTNGSQIKEEMHHSICLCMHCTCTGRQQDNEQWKRSKNACNT